MVKTKVRKITTRQLAIEAARIANDRHCEDIVVLDLRGISPVADYFAIFTGTSGRQMASVADEIADAGAKAGHRAFHVAGLKSDQWVLLDFFDVVVHIFDEEHRRYYDLELIWGDAPRVRWEKRAAEAQRTQRTD